jgi:hypothetical protein
MNAEFLFFLADLESGRAALNDQRRDSFFTFGGFRIGVHNRRIGHSTVSDPGFCAVDHVAVAAPLRTRRERSRVRTCLRLGERVTADFFAASVGQQKLLLLRFRAKAMNRIAIQRILHGQNHPRGGAHTGNFLDYD